MKEILNINEAYLALVDGLVVLDSYGAHFKIKDKQVLIKGDNSFYSLSEKEFLDIYKESKFVLLEDSDEIIDIEKDKEYYSFKHK